ncbi:MAG: SDR family NAD(P)-dependent oxidoreductase [Lewinellaceae bacterium]|nr:SDR family NAD(P)-dependent oxidoreductase [Phaeodactylibacter sp.]MCB0611821.1 SDR family NAD(P)-dependent oxidoreductase [Phaeodactylibacter sp.]MCB9349283.1 SDR family NAD(P)-dependent oxidoreductase [Lewinellaceae bacterium]
MSTKNIAIAYCADNEQVVKQLEQQLSSSGYQFQHFAGTKTTAGTPLADQLLNQPNPILLIVSDNFLKAAQCMQHGLKLLQEKRTQILPIVIEGLSEDEQTGKSVKIQTDFERVSDIIQYINYWQDQYLDLRRQKRHMKDFDENAFNSHLKIMREISSEAGEFLRVLRGMNYLTHQELVDNSFEHFFKFNDDPSGWSRFKALGATYTAARPVSPDIVEEMPAEEPPAPAEEKEKIEVKQESPAPVVEEEKAEEEQAPLHLADIPGIDLIEEPVQEELPEEAPEEEAPVGEETSEDEIAAAITSGLEDAFRFAPPAEETTIAEVEFEVEAESAARSLSAVESEEVLQPEEDENERADFYLDDDEDDDLSEEEPLTPGLESQKEEENGEEEEEEEDDNEEDKVSDLVEEALEYFNTGQVQEGLAFMAQAVEEYPDNPYLRYHYALMLAQRGRDYLSARKVLKPVVEAEPDNEHALFLMGELNELLEDFDAARHYYLQLIDVNSRYPHAHYRLGLILSAHFEGKQKAASKYFKKAIKQDDQNADAYYQYALLLNEAMDKPKKAVKLLKQTLEIAPRHPFANYDLALAYLQMGHRAKARKAYARAIVINPELHTPENDLAFREKVPSASVSTAEQDTIEALKANISSLEELLNSREAEAALLRQEMEAEKEKIEAVPKIGQTVLITGATSGIGRATAEIFAQNGYRVIITGRRAKRLEELKARFKEESGADVLAIAYDVRDGAAVEEVMEKLGEKGMEVDILINNAGKAKGLAPIHEGQIAHWEEMIDTNLKGLLYMTRAVSPGMVKRKSGHIINVSSTAGRDVYPSGNVYCATKAAVEALTKAMRLDLHQHNVRVSMVSPAHVEETEFALVRFDGNEEQANIYEGFKPLSARDVAEAIFFMASRPAHVNVLDVVLQGVQQASSLLIDRSGREQYEEEEEED